MTSSELYLLTVEHQTKNTNIRAVQLW